MSLDSCSIFWFRSAKGTVEPWSIYSTVVSATLHVLASNMDFLYPNASRLLCSVTIREGNEMSVDHVNARNPWEARGSRVLTYRHIVGSVGGLGGGSDCETSSSPRFVFSIRARVTPFPCERNGTVSRLFYLEGSSHAANSTE